MTDEAESPNLFLISFGTEGGEMVANLSAHYEDAVLEKLMDDNAKTPIFDSQKSSINSYQYRVRANSHRHIETYTMEVDVSITEADIWEWFNDNPQSLMDLLRDRGTLIKQLSCPANFEWSIGPKHDV